MGKPLNWDPVEMERWPLGTLCLNFDPNVAKELLTRINFELLSVNRNLREQLTRTLDQIFLFLSLILLSEWSTSGAKHNNDRFRCRKMGEGKETPFLL